MNLTALPFITILYLLSLLLLFDALRRAQRSGRVSAGIAPCLSAVAIHALLLYGLAATA